MGFWSKLVILTLAVLAFCYVKVNFFDTPNLKVEKKLVAEEMTCPVRPESGKTEVESCLTGRNFQTPGGSVGL